MSSAEPPQSSESPPAIVSLILRPPVPEKKTNGPARRSSGPALVAPKLCDAGARSLFLAVLRPACFNMVFADIAVTRDATLKLLQAPALAKTPFRRWLQAGAPKRRPT